MRVRKYSVRRNASQMSESKAAIAQYPEIFEALAALTGNRDTAAASLQMILARGGRGVTIIT